MSRWFGKRRTPEHGSPSGESSDHDQDVGIPSDESFVIIDKAFTPETAVVTDAFVIGNDNNPPSPNLTPQSPLALESTLPGVAGRGLDTEHDFIALTNPSVEAIANAKIQILRNNLTLQEERIGGHKQQVQSLLEKHAEQRQKDGEDYERSLETQMQVHLKETCALTQRYFAVEHKHHREIEDRDQDRGVEIKKLQQTHDAEKQGRKQQHDAEVAKLTREHEAGIERSMQAHTAEVSATILAAADKTRSHDAGMEELQKDHEARLQVAVVELKEEIDFLKQYHESVVSSKERSHSADAETVEQAHEDAVEKLAADHYGEVDVLKRKYERLEQSHVGELRDLQIEHDSRLNATSDQAIVNAKHATRRHTKEIEDIRTKNKSDFDEAEKSHDVRQFADSQMHEAEVNQLHSQIEGLKSELEKVKSQANKFRKERDNAPTPRKLHLKDEAALQVDDLLAWERQVFERLRQTWRKEQRLLELSGASNDMLPFVRDAFDP
ncbi:hypothetical protein LTR36_008489 [Oleoguttula mirabilis]|uniref:Uncharacterized protein n=1 Tax=Oleoguttula mirabilis TaxID=1507867 RepID=A0AAV9JSP5_9PEZI|nr:hypothetical protein LTR36_008489 [Oleoguttula mirabilis]